MPELPLIALQHPLAGGRQRRRPTSSAELAADRQRRRGQAGQQRRARADRGPGGAGRQRRHLPARRSSSAAPAASSSPRTWSAPQMREMWDAAQAGDIERAREIDAELRPLYEALCGDDQPDPVEGGARDARRSPPARLRLPLVPADDEQRAVVRAALESVGVPAADRDFEATVTSGSKKLRVLPLGGLGEIGKNMTVVEYDGRIVVVDTGLMFPTAGDARHRPRPARLLLPARPRRRHRGDRPHPRPRGPRRGAALRAARDRRAAGDLRRPADDRDGPLEARRAQARRRAAAGAAGGGEGAGSARSSWS